jgi:hypothetical protein
MATGNPPGAHPAAADQAVFLDRLLGVAGTRGLIAARRRQPAEDDSIEPNEPDADCLHEVVGPPSTPPRVNSRRRVPTSASWSASTSGGRAMMRTSQPGWNEGAITLSASRSRRLTRLRTTAPPSLRPVDSPNRVVSRSVRRKRAMRSGWDRLVPLLWIAAKSCGRESITSRRGSGPRPSVRPSVASDPVPAERPGRGVPRWSSSGRGSRAPSRDGASWAGRSASSSGFCAILSIRPRDSTCDPKRHANAPGARGARRVRRRGG